MDSSLITQQALPEDAFLSIQYIDPLKRVMTLRVYHTDGRLRIFDSQQWRVACCFSGDELAQIRETLRACGLFTAEDVADSGVSDPALWIWRWRLGEERGAAYNRAYPVRTHAAMECAHERLLQIEANAAPCAEQ
ncbi:MAG: hypothetical protein HXY40_17905 [Chloroflexi bacterium]|nr:hypothetical protein [Chloroflexota bacterium]